MNNCCILFQLFRFIKMGKSLLQLTKSYSQLLALLYALLFCCYLGVLCLNQSSFEGKTCEETECQPVCPRQSSCAPKSRNQGMGDRTHQQKNCNRGFKTDSHCNPKSKCQPRSKLGCSTIPSNLGTPGKPRLNTGCTIKVKANFHPGTNSECSSNRTSRSSRQSRGRNY